MESMDLMEDELMEDLSYDEAEGAADFGSDLGEEEFDEYESGEEDLGEEEDYWGSGEDEFEDEFEGEGFDEFDEFGDEYGFEEADGAFEDAMAYALAAEDADEFFGRLIRGISRIAPKIIRGVRRAGSVVGRVARVAAPIASLIPHPYAQIAATGLGLLSKLRAEGASEEEAFEAMAELAAYDEAAIPLVAGLAARTVLKRKGARLPKQTRKLIVRSMTKAARTLVNKRGPKAIRALPKIVSSVRRTAVVRRTPVRAIPKVVRRTVVRVSRSRPLIKKLSRPAPRAVRRVRFLRGRMMPRSFVVQGPVRISIAPGI